MKVVCITLKNPVCSDNSRADSILFYDNAIIDEGMCECWNNGDERKSLIPVDNVLGLIQVKAHPLTNPSTEKTS